MINVSKQMLHFGLDPAQYFFHVASSSHLVQGFKNRPFVGRFWLFLATDNPARFFGCSVSLF